MQIHCTVMVMVHLKRTMKENVNLTLHYAPGFLGPGSCVTALFYATLLHTRGGESVVNLEGQDEAARRKTDRHRNGPRHTVGDEHGDDSNHRKAPVRWSMTIARELRIVPEDRTPAALEAAALDSGCERMARQEDVSCLFSTGPGAKKVLGAPVLQLSKSRPLELLWGHAGGEAHWVPEALEALQASGSAALRWRKQPK